MINKEKIILTFDVSYNISHNEEYFCCVGRTVNLYDVHTGERKICFKDMDHPSFSAFTTDNRLIVKTATGHYMIYDLDKKERIRKINPPKGVLGSTSNFVVTPDNKFIISFAEIFPYAQLVLLEIETGEYRFYHIDDAVSCRILYNESESKYYIAASKRHINDDRTETQNTELYLFTYPFQEFALQSVRLTDMSVSEFDYNRGRFALAGYSDVVRIYDTDTALTEQFHYDKDMVLYHMEWSKNGKYLVLVETFTVFIYDVAAKKCIKTYDVDHGCFASFYDNDTKLLIGTWNEGYLIDIF